MLYIYVRNIKDKKSDKNHLIIEDALFPFLFFVFDSFGKTKTRIYHLAGLHDNKNIRGWT